MTYRIKNWSTLFETCETRKLKKLTWVPVPNKHDGKGYRRILRLQEGPLVYAAWLLMLQIASKCPERGVLADEDGPLCAMDLADKTDFPVKYFDLAFKALVRPEIGWLECDESPAIAGDSPATPATPPVRMEGNGREVSILTDFDVFYKAYPKHVARNKAEKAYKKARQEATADDLLNGARRYAAECLGKDPQYIKHPATWLNGGCWQDEQAPADGPADYNGGWKPTKSIADAVAAGLVPDCEAPRD